MSTENQQILPIPESVIVGSGGYVIPANKYGYFQANVSSVGQGYIGTSNSYNSIGGASGSSTNTNSRGVSGNGAANHAHQWVVSGNNISASVNSPAGQIQCNNASSVFFANYRDGYAIVYLNGVSFCSANSSAAAFRKDATTFSEYVGYSFTGQLGWSVSIFPIPKNNLPPELITP